ncbi:fatty acid synthase [Trichonephila clavipes]|nr:fatty acid synthase [Trichonephila clavipes]
MRRIDVDENVSNGRYQPPKSSGRSRATTGWEDKGIVREAVIASSSPSVSCQRSKTCVPAFQDKYAQKLTSGGIAFKNLNVEFAHRNPNREIPLLEEYHFVPFHKENILSKSNKMTLMKYIDACNSIVKKTLEFLGKSRDEVSNILKGCTFADDASTAEYIESQTDNHILRKSLCAIMDATTDQDFVQQVENQVKSYLFQRDGDMLSETLLQEKPLREVIDIVLENNASGKLNIAEVSNCSLLLCSKINEVIQKNCVNVNYTVAHSNLELMDKNCLPSQNVSVSSWDPDNSLSFKDIDLFVMKYLICSKEEHTRTLKNALATIKDGGFVILLQKTRLAPAEIFLSSMGKTTVPVFLEPDLEQTFKELKLRIICKKSDALTSTLYLLRKESVKSYQDSVIRIEEGKYEKWVNELKEEIIEITSHPKDPKRIWLVSEGTNFSGIIGLVNCLRLEPGGTSIRCVFISETAPALPQFNPKLQFYQEIMEKDLTMNVFKANSWGTYRHFKLSEGLLLVITKPVCSVFGSSLFRRQVFLHCHLDTLIIHLFISIKKVFQQPVASVTSKRKKAAAPTENNTSDNTSNAPKSLVKRETRKRAIVDEDGFRLPPKKQTANPIGMPFLSSPAAILMHPNSSAPSASPIILSNASEEIEFDTEQAAVAPKVKIPPFFIQPNPDWTDLMVFAHSLAPTLQSKLSERFLRITVQSEEEYRKLATYFRHEQIAFKSFMLKSERPLKLILRGLPTSTELEAVKKEIESEGFKIHKISRLRYPTTCENFFLKKRSYGDFFVIFMFI